MDHQDMITYQANGTLTINKTTYVHSIIYLTLFLIIKYMSNNNGNSINSLSCNDLFYVKKSFLEPDPAPT